MDSSQTQNLPLNQIVKRTGWYNIELPEIVFAAITEIECRGLNSPDIFKKPMPKSEVMTIIGQFDRLEEVDLSKTDVYLLAAVLKGKKCPLNRIYGRLKRNLAFNPVNILSFRSIFTWLNP